MLRWRFATAAVLAPAILAAIYLGRWTVVAAVLIFAGLAARELSRALRPLSAPAAITVALAPVVLAIPLDEVGALAGVMLSLPVILLWLVVRPERRSLRSAVGALLGSVWIGAAFAHLILLSELPEPVVPLLIAVVGPWISDAGAYFCGLFFGRHRIFPLASPNKTVEGAVGGGALTVLAVGLASAVFLGLPALAAVFLGGVVALFSQAGDLFESLLKRILDIKDTGHMLPGHGGVLDRIDSLLFTAPAVYYALLIIHP
ncbi:hypothetical protein E0L93_07810 [Rubrobacter taiwanensis]|jgi:phosphatidate cytidylyltransferase|uniref:Phosphatidate cytidylyltransferase n=1 Tax=Rubrobacter taiwanensis TaxID=185139 RepID=A0A4R1BHN6_9ACTN|nr:phosphatidate cytidylyltransferase [Rubrobacter taiwanensis]TCJ16638.1 hypothetical protein E0L93_07810 [Rubrobacter taiwanensis]